MQLVAVLGNVTTSQASISINYWLAVLSFASGVVTIILAEFVVRYAEKRRSRPQIVVEPRIMLQGDAESFLVDLKFRTASDVPLLQARGSIHTYFPKIVIDGKLTELTRPDWDVRKIKWYFGGDAKRQRTTDLYPWPESLQLNVCYVARAKDSGLFGIGISDSPENELFGDATGLMFSKSIEEPQPTRDLRIAHLVFIRGTTTAGEWFRQRYILLLAIPNFGGVGTDTCDLAKATFKIVHQGISEDIEDFMKSMGFDTSSDWAIATTGGV